MTHTQRYNRSNSSGPKADDQCNSKINQVITFEEILRSVFCYQFCVVCVRNQEMDYQTITTYNVLSMMAQNPIFNNYLYSLLRNPPSTYIYENFWNNHPMWMKAPSPSPSLMPYLNDSLSDEEDEKKIMVNKVNDFMMDTILSHETQKDCCQTSDCGCALPNNFSALVPDIIMSSMNTYDDPKTMENVASRSAETRNGKFVCYVCKRSFTRRYALKVHFR